MPKLTIKLKQHTPLIHFQHDQDGATLRASEVKPKLDKYIINKLKKTGEYDKGVREGWIKRKNDKEWLDYKMRFEDTIENIHSYETNKKRPYTDWNRNNDRKKGNEIVYVYVGQTLKDYNPRKQSLVIREGNNEYIAKRRESDSRVIYALSSYNCFFANVDADITDMQEYRKVTMAKESFCMVLLIKDNRLYEIINNKATISSFFLNHNFGTRQSKGFGSFYVDKEDPLYDSPEAKYTFGISAINDEKGFKELFKQVELFTKSIRAGINVKDDKKNTLFYFKSLAFMYCKDELKAEWDKKRVKTEFYFASPTDRKKDSLSSQRKRYEGEKPDILFFDSDNGYDIRDMLGFSTNEAWMSYKDSIEKKVAILKGDKLDFPRKQDSVPVDRMRSPLLVKPIYDDVGSYKVFLVFQDEEVGMEEFKNQQKICFTSTKEKVVVNGKPLSKRFMLPLPKKFSMENYFAYIFNKLHFDIATHVNEKYHERPEYKNLSNIYSQLSKS